MSGGENVYDTLCKGFGHKKSLRHKAQMFGASSSELLSQPQGFWGMPQGMLKLGKGHLGSSPPQFGRRSSWPRPRHPERPLCTGAVREAFALRLESLGAQYQSGTRMCSGTGVPGGRGRLGTSAAFCAVMTAVFLVSV